MELLLVNEALKPKTANTYSPPRIDDLYNLIGAFTVEVW